MTDSADVDPWLATACEQIAVDAFEELVGRLDVAADRGDGGERLDTFRASAREMIRERIAALLAASEGPEMVFQPIVMLETRQTIGVEALSRFPTGPSPAHWFREAQDVGMSSELQLSALMKALELIDELPGNLLCVNVTPRLLEDHRLFNLLGHVDANRVVVEINQPEAITDAKQLLSGLTALRSLGLRIAFDDVGTGFLGLQHVIDIEPEIIKLSPELTTGFDPGAADLEPARRLVEAARRSGTFVIAKQVESATDVDVLEQLGVEAAQGFYLGEPRPAGQLVA